ncbi:15-cis-phytoene synthase CrtB [Salinicola avicenniae]|uniref:15-cis-phytoene synthase CrtB n=1 Tax=Salinicola avicenniae TaxID=2916836 RepID=UPI002074329D|nr:MULTISPECIES: 15-cis-phytoene synthase CrtB [unclassified Salinicola]
MSEPLLDHATQTMAAGSKSFATAARLFDPATRRSALMLYAWCRHCDDVIDGQQLGFAAGCSGADAADGPAQRLARLEAETRRACAGEPMSDPAFAAFQEVALRHEIPESQALDHLTGYAMDVRGDRYPHLADTLRYCYHVAGVVGLMMARVMGVRDDAVLDRACDLGLAFQLTNIARDIVDDAQMDRCYLPLAWLEEFAVPRAELAAPQHRPALGEMARRLVAVAEPYYASAREGLPALPLRSAWAIATARGVYRRIGLKVAVAGENAWSTRQGTGKAEKLGLLLAGGGVALSARRHRPCPRPEALWQRPR